MFISSIDLLPKLRGTFLLACSLNQYATAQTRRYTIIRLNYSLSAVILVNEVHPGSILDKPE
ncbi:MAG: hypothetical protein AAB553_02455 [Patescibacteria group bacterium]